MAEPTLKDVLKALSRLESRLESSLAEVHGEMATKSELAKIDAKVDTLGAKVDAHRVETARGFEDLDRDLDEHMKATASWSAISKR
jgi:copper chaperone CopZ